MTGRRVVVIGSGPITIGQGAEFDYAGTQAIEALHEEGAEVILVNPNPATVMTDPNLAERVYLEPLTVTSLGRILAREKPDALLATLGGQAGLNLAVGLADAGYLAAQGVEFLGTPIEAIRTAEDRARFRSLMLAIGQPVPRSAPVHSMERGRQVAEELGFPLVVRPAFTLGGTGGGLVYSTQELETVLGRALALSPVHQALLEASILGWTEVEFEVMRDRTGARITICPMENLDPVGVHTGDSLVVAPILTLPDPVVQRLRKAALDVADALELVGGANVQFGVSPDRAQYAVIEVNPRVSRSSALASKATGYPIARVATKLAFGRTLATLDNPVAHGSTAALEPTIDYVVVKIPRFPFDKFPSADRRLGTEMRATGEAMAIDQTFRAALQKAVRAWDGGATGLYRASVAQLPDDILRDGIQTAHDRRLFYLAEALRRGMAEAEVTRLSGFAPFFIGEIGQIIRDEAWLAKAAQSARAAGRTALSALNSDTLIYFKREGFSDARLGQVLEFEESEIRSLRHAFGIRPVYKRVDTCAAEFEAETPYTYATYATEDEAPKPAGKTVIVLGSGPIRIGQGIEFDCSAVHALEALRSHGWRAVMINTNPETVSTDATRSDRLVFEPLTVEDTLEVVEHERAQGVIVQFAGQTGVKLAGPLRRAGVRVLGTDADGIDLAEDRQRFDQVLERLGVDRPQGGQAASREEALALAARIGYPTIVRPSFVIGGRAMAVLEGPEELKEYFADALQADPDRPVRIDQYIPGRELEVDAVADGVDAAVCGILAHVERAGVHSGDSVAVFPAQGLAANVEEELVATTRRLAKALSIRGLLNIQFVLGPTGRLGVLEVNPRASRTVPILEKATGRPIAAWAALLCLGMPLQELGIAPGLLPPPRHVAVKVPVFSFGKLPQVDAAVGPEMKSTGEAMALGDDLPSALLAAYVAAGLTPRNEGGVLLTVADRDKPDVIDVAKRFHKLGFALLATPGTAAYLAEAGLSAQSVAPIGCGRPDLLDLLTRGAIALVVNTPGHGHGPARDGFRIRRAAVERGIPCLTSLETVASLILALERGGDVRPPRPIQDYLAQAAAPR